MTRMKIRTIFVFSILLLSNLLVMNPVSADSHILPKIGDGEPQPIIDGNITSLEWNTSVILSTELHGQETSVFVTTNSSHLFIGFNMSASDFVAVNDTVPVYNSTIANYTLGYNNATHDWFALVLDNNLDKTMNTESIASKESPDDAIVIDRYRSGAYDASTDGNASVIFRPDTQLSYIGPNETTIIEGSSGEENVQIGRNITDDQVIYELVKPLTSTDVNGSDFVLDSLGVLQFKLFRWTNSIANDTMTAGPGSVDQSAWFSLRVNDTGTGIATQTLGNTTINVIHNNVELQSLDAFDTFTSLYGFDVTYNTAQVNTTLDNYDLNILILNEDSVYSETEINQFISYIRSGGKAIIMLGGAEASTDLAEKFELTYLPNSVILPISINETKSEINITNFTDTLKIATGENPVTSFNVTDVAIQSSAFNMSRISSDNRYILDQEYLNYDLFESPEDLVYDQTDDAFINETESFNLLSLGMAFDFLKGGRISILPSNSFVLDNEITNQDNAIFLLRLLPWVSRIVDTVQITSTAIEKHELNEMEETTISVNMTDVFGETLLSTPTIIAKAEIGGTVVRIITLNQVGNTSIYEGKLSVAINGFIQIQITGFLEAFGFAEGDTLSIFVNADVFSFNDLSQLSLIIAIVFLISVIATAMVYIRIKRIAVE